MPSSLKMGVAEMVRKARSKITQIDAADVMTRLQDDDVVIVDLRDIRERQRDGFIPGSFHCPRGMTEFWVDPDSPYYKDVFDRDATFIFHCASGWRSALTVATLVDMGMDNVAHITDGFGSWKKVGGPIKRDE